METKNKIRNFFRIIILAPIALFLLYCAYFFIENPLHPKYLDCGKVISKSSEEVVIKYGTQTELFLNIQFEKSGFKSIKCEPTTYFGTKKGEKVCFNLSQEKSGWYTIKTGIGVLVCGVLILIGIVMLIIYLVGPENLKD